MENLASSGFALVVIAGALNGSFAVPMKRTPNWAWENVWLAWSAIGLLILPLGLTVTTVPDIMSVYLRSEPMTLLVVFASGLVWGISQILFGLGINRIGIGLGFAIVISLAAATGSLVPLLLYPTHAANTFVWPRLAAGILLVLAGVGFCSYASKLKEHASEASIHNARSGLFLCVSAGIGGAMINVGMVAGARIADLAAKNGARPVNQTNAIWLPLLFAGFVATAAYCTLLLTKRGHWQQFWASQTIFYWVLALIMALCWFGSVELYGIAAARLGQAGPVLGWPVFLSSSIATANIWGAATGEWRNTAVQAKRLMLAGVGVLMVAMFITAIAHRS
ncbi:MAG: L-rhamnose/proton symporter RhaT [Bryobacteraceae bacterium]